MEKLPPNANPLSSQKRLMPTALPFDLSCPYILSMTSEPEEIDPAHLPAVLEGLAQAKRRQLATDAEVEAAFRCFEQ
jgi:hypothetical protein